MQAKHTQSMTSLHAEAWGPHTASMQCSQSTKRYLGGPVSGAQGLPFSARQRARSSMKLARHMGPGVGAHGSARPCMRLLGAKAERLLHEAEDVLCPEASQVQQGVARVEAGEGAQAAGRCGQVSGGPEPQGTRRKGAG